MTENNEERKYEAGRKTLYIMMIFVAFGAILAIVASIWIQFQYTDLVIDLGLAGLFKFVTYTNLGSLLIALFLLSSTRKSKNPHSE